MYTSSPIGWALDDQREACLVNRRSERARQTRSELGQFGRLVKRLDTTCLNAGKIEQRVDEPQQPQRIAMDERELRAMRLAADRVDLSRSSTGA